MHIQFSESRKTQRKCTVMEEEDIFKETQCFRMNSFFPSEQRTDMKSPLWNTNF